MCSDICSLSLSLSFRTKSRELAKYHFIADSTSQGHILAIAYGSEVSAIGLEVEGNNVHEEASHITEALLDIYKESQLIYSVKVGVPAANESPADEGSEVVPTISITDFSAMAIAIEHFKTDLVFLFCEQGMGIYHLELFLDLWVLFEPQTVS